jgi:outer membrane protein OmpA-like peptidoglycan-associated protein
MKNRFIILLILILIPVISYSEDTNKDDEVKLTPPGYKHDLQINIGYDLMREVSKGPRGPFESEKRKDQGYSLGLEYLLQPSDSKAIYGAGFDYRSKLKDNYQKLNTSIPLYLSVRYPIYHDRFYLIGKGGYNLTQDADEASTTGGHYLAAGIGKKLGYLQVEALWENMGAEYKNDLGSSGYGVQNSVGIKFGLRLGDLYYDITHPSSEKTSKPVEQKQPEVKEQKVVEVKKERVVEVRKVYVIKEPGVKYKVNRYRLTKDAKQYLARLKEQELQDGSYKRVSISGYTDKSGSEEYNQKLSEKRAKTVVDYLNLPTDRVVVKGLGETNPLGGAPEEDRRVEIEIIR